MLCSGPTDSTKAAGEGDDAGERRSLETAETGGSATVRGSLSAAAASRLLRVEAMTAEAEPSTPPAIRRGAECRR